MDITWKGRPLDDWTKDVVKDIIRLHVGFGSYTVFVPKATVGDESVAFKVTGTADDLCDHEDDLCDHEHDVNADVSINWRDL